MKTYTYIFLFFLLCLSLPSCSYKKIDTNNDATNNQNKLFIDKKNISKIFYIGLGMWGNGETWSEKDVIDLEKVFRKIYHNRNFYSHIFSNKGVPSSSQYPYFSEKKLRQQIKKISDSASIDDIVIVVISSHGFPEGINFRVGMLKSKVITGKEITEIFAPLNNKNSFFVISSCYSGSLIDDLAGSLKVILTASSAKKPSFGCEKNSPNSWFIEALKESHNILNREHIRFSIKKWFSKTKEIVKNKEESYGYPQSLPQIYIGENINPFVFLL